MPLMPIWRALNNATVTDDALRVTPLMRQTRDAMIEAFQIVLERLVVSQKRIALLEAEVDGLRASLNKFGPVPSSIEVIEMLDAIARRKKIDAIKLLRTIAGLPLKEAKDKIDAVYGPPLVVTP